MANVVPLAVPDTVVDSSIPFYDEYHLILILISFILSIAILKKHYYTIWSNNLLFIGKIHFSLINHEMLIFPLPLWIIPC